MKTKLTEANQELFDNIMSHTFYVVDTEYTATGKEHGKGNSIISIAIVPVVQGQRTSKSELYLVMNPGVPITAASRAKHGFTDKDVNNKQHFSYYAPKIVKAFCDDDAVFVSHTAVDIRAIRGELERLDTRKASGEPKIKAGLQDLPNLPIIDTSRLAKQIGYPEAGQKAIISLERLCELTEVTNKKPHDALSDARATADALIELLAYAAQINGVTDLQEILNKHNAGTTSKPLGVIDFHNSTPSDLVLPPEHLAKHNEPLVGIATKKVIKKWLILVNECASLRCQFLVQEAQVAGNLNAKKLVTEVSELLEEPRGPGQAGTLAGALAELILPKERDGEPGLTYNGALQMWRKARPRVAKSIPCGKDFSEQCPDCREGNACPLDTIYQLVAQIALLGRNDPLTQKQIKDHFAKNNKSQLGHWARTTHKDIAAYAAWYIIDKELRANKGTAAQKHLNRVRELGLEKCEPRLALLECDVLLFSNKTDAAFKLCDEVLEKRTTDDGFTELVQWRLNREQAIQANAKAATKAPSTHPRLARPSGRTNENPYSVT